MKHGCLVHGQQNKVFNSAVLNLITDFLTDTLLC